jgi:hypothetical protein
MFCFEAYNHVSLINESIYLNLLIYDIKLNCILKLDFFKNLIYKVNLFFNYYQTIIL